MKDYGIKVSKPGFDVLTAKPHELAFSSKYQLLKISSQGSGSITHSGGRTVTIPHNLGYVPMFLVHTVVDPAYSSIYGSVDDYFICPFAPTVGACHLDRGVIAYADDTNLYITVRPDFGWYYHTVNDYASKNGLYIRSSALLGNSSTLDPYDAAFRFALNLDKDESIYEALLGFQVREKEGSSDVPCNIYGVDEDNVDGFHSDPFGKTKTTATYSESASGGFSVGDVWEVGVTEIVEEVIARSAWSSGNNIALLLFDNGAADGNYIATQSNFESGYPTCTESYLAVLKSNSLIDYKYTIFLNEIS